MLSPSSHAQSDEQQTRQQQLREINDQALNLYLSSGMDPNKKRDIAFVLTSTDKTKLESLRGELHGKGLKVGKVWMLKKDDNGEHHLLEIIFKQSLDDKDKLLKYCQLIDDIARENQVQFIGWASGN